MAAPQNNPPPELQHHLDSLDQLISSLDRALADQDWDSLVSLNTQVEASVKPLMAALEAGQVDSELIRTRLETLRQFMDAAAEAAAGAKAEAEQALKGVNRNRNAAKAYQNISTARPK
ncbi:MAG: SOS cell division inhibitor [Marinobacter sp.]|nr:SOS cell division inhibitor [Marinobacter sp.]